MYLLVEPKRLESLGVDGTSSPVRILEQLPMLLKVRRRIDSV